MANEVKEGIVLYSIELNNCLNGVWTNEAPPNDGIIRNEISKKLPEKDQKTIADKTNWDNKVIEGTYKCAFIEIDNTIYTGKLEISRESANGTYTFKWEIIDNECKKVDDEYEGVGYIMNEKQIAVHYWQIVR